jgi:hypothetical protein
VSEIGELRVQPFIVDRVSFGQHLLVEYTQDQNASGLLAVKQDMPPIFHTPQPGANIIAGMARGRVAGEHATTGFQAVDVTDRLILAPPLESIGSDFQEVRFGTLRKPECSHG